LGSQPTANKRLQELIGYGLVESKEGEDRRQRILTLTKEGYIYLEACSAVMSKVLNQQAAM
jgi:DNA-binding MarR family transcriptional regulator